MKKLLIVALTILLLLKPTNAYAAETNEEYEKYVEEICSEYGICPELIESIIFYESSWQPNVVSSAGCIGLMQIHPKSHAKRIKELEITDLTDPKQNILVGVDLINDLFSQYNEVSIVLDAYAGNLKSEATYEAGYVSKYAKLVLARSEELERKHGK